MERIILQSEVPNSRTCARPKIEGAEITPTDIGKGCGRKTCITCSAMDTTSGSKKEDFPINNSSILQHWEEMRTHPQFKNWAIPEKIDKMCAFMANMAKADRKELSRVGA
eukprot:2888057-Heterocapsa_arctica.AAC.1